MKIIIILLKKKKFFINVIGNDNFIPKDYIENINNEIILFNKQEFVAKQRYNKYKKTLIEQYINALIIVSTSMLKEKIKKFFVMQRLYIYILI